jgi:multidrug resistance efflux pump
MPAALLIPIFQLLLKLVPFLYQIKVLKSEADMKELQRKFEAAIRKAEEGSLDSTKLKKQHDDNMDDLKQKRNKVGW